MSIDLTQQTFSDFIASGRVLVDFWAPWCGPCKMQNPILDEIASQILVVKIGKLNMDDHADLASEYGVHTIPFLRILKDGRKMTEFVGLQQANGLIDALNAVA